MSNCICKLLGHKFQPRYSTKENLKSVGEVFNWQIRGQAFPIDFSELTQRLKCEEKTYEGDICIRCGMIVQKSS